MYGLSAARSIPTTIDTYCEPISEDAQICRADDGEAWRCVDERGYWECRRVL
jgi:hypothetical protein